jgi:hypothetical protein
MPGKLHAIKTCDDCRKATERRVQYRRLKAIGINYAVTVVLLRETIRDAEEKQGFSGLPRVAMSQICLTGLERCELSSLGRLQSLQIMLWETVSITMLLIR